MNLRELARTNHGAAEARLAEALDGHWVVFAEGQSGVSDLALAAQFAPDDSGRQTLVGLLLLADAITSDQLRRVPVAALEQSVNLSRKGATRELDAAKRRLRPLRREAGMSPEDFSQRVAEHFRLWARYVPHPVAALAAEWDVKAPTMASWVREARLRGLLPPARRRKA